MGDRRHRSRELPSQRRCFALTNAKAGLFICPECGERVRVTEEVEPWACPKDGTTMEHESESSVVDKDELEELVMKWRTEANELLTQTHDPVAKRGEALMEASRELEELL